MQTDHDEKNSQNLHKPVKGTKWVCRPTMMMSSCTGGRCNWAEGSCPPQQLARHEGPVTPLPLGVLHLQGAARATAACQPQLVPESRYALPAAQAQCHALTLRQARDAPGLAECVPEEREGEHDL